MTSRRIKPVRINNEWITSTYKNFPIRRLLDEKQNKKKKVIKGLTKASKSHAAQAKTLKGVLKNGKRSKSRNR